MKQYNLGVKIIMVIAMIVIFSMGACGVNKNVNKDIVRNILYDVYTPKSMEEFNKSRDKYIDMGAMSVDEANALFVTNGAKELDEKDLARKLDITSIMYSPAKDNTVGTDLYKCDCTLTYDGKNTNFEILFTCNTSGVITRHDISVK